jgi:cytochrome c oxidase subunit 2
VPILKKLFSAAAACCAAVIPAQAAPLQYLSGASDKAAPVVALTWGVLSISVIVMLIIAALLAGAIWRRPGVKIPIGGRGAVGEDGGGLGWLWTGVGLSTLALLFTVVWTMAVLARIDTPRDKPAFTIEITGKQWWWQAHYVGGNPGRDFTTANEIHIPAGAPVALKLIGGDVIHSFWVPQLAGKMDAIPGQTNETWIEAKAPGRYFGQCTEYCGVQHAKMALVLVADSPEDFRKWWAHQLDAPAMDNVPGQDVFEAHCGNCHAVRGTDAVGTLGPDLSHLMTRGTIASASIVNSPVHLAQWVANPQSMKPGNAMPAIPLKDDERRQILSYLGTLK